MCCGGCVTTFQLNKLLTLLLNLDTCRWLYCKFWIIHRLRLTSYESPRPLRYKRISGRQQNIFFLTLSCPCFTFFMSFLSSIQITQSKIWSCAQCKNSAIYLISKDLCETHPINPFCFCSIFYQTSEQLVKLII